jgi:hypothetical protein
VEDLRGFEDAAAARAAEAHRAREPGPRLAELEPTPNVKEWVANVRDLAREDRGYRDGSRHPELLVRVAEDPTAPAAHRVGAALALSGAPAPIKARVRVAAEETVEEEVADAMLDALAGKVHRRVIARVAARPRDPARAPGLVGRDP